MLEQDLYTLLSGTAALTEYVGTRIYPASPTEDTTTPFVVYSFTSADPTITLDGSAGLTKHTLELEVWAVNAMDVLNVGTVLRQTLHTYRGGPFRLISLTNDNLPKETGGYSKVQTYTVWAASTGTITATPNSTGTVVTGNNSVTLNACGHVLSLNCDGLTLDGGAVGGSLPTDPQFNSVGLYDSVNDWYPTLTAADNTVYFANPDGSGSDVSAGGVAATSVAIGGGGNPANTPLYVQAAPSQTAPLTVWNKSNGTPALSLKLEGDRPIFTMGSTSSAQGIGFRSDNGTEVMKIQNNGAVYVSNFGTTGGLQIFDYGMSRGGSDGWIRFDGYGSPAVRIGGNPGGSYTAAVRAEGVAAGVPVLVAKGVSGQTADLGQWTDSTGAVLAKVSAAGDVEVTDATRGVVLRSPNGTRYRLLVSDSGTLSTVAA